jgi:hypothetical protein
VALVIVRLEVALHRLDRGFHLLDEIAGDGAGRAGGQVIGLAHLIAQQLGLGDQGPGHAHEIDRGAGVILTVHLGRRGLALEFGAAILPRR